MLQDSPQSTAELLHQVHMMSHITCPLIHPLHSLLNKVLIPGEWCHPASSSLPCPLPSQLSCLQSSLPSPLSTCLVLGVCYVIQPVDLFPSSVQYYSTIINANLHQSTILVVASYKARKRFLHEYLQVQIHSIMQWYHWYYASKDR